MATQINFIMAKNEQEYLSNGMELLKKHGVISGYADVVSGTKYKYPNVSAFKNGQGVEPDGFMVYFKKKYGKKVAELKDVPVPAKQSGKRDYRDFAKLEAENKFKQQEIDRLNSELKMKDCIIADKQMIIDLLRSK